MKYYYLINVKIMSANEKMPTLEAYKQLYESQKYHSFFDIDFNNWKLKLQPCEISESELENIEVWLSENSYDGDWRYPIEVTDIIFYDNGVITFKPNKNKNMKKPLVVEVFADNGEFSHWSLIDLETSVKLWSENPEECKAMGYAVEQPKQVEEIEAVDEIWEDLIDVLMSSKSLSPKQDIELLKSKFNITRKNQK